MPTFRLDMTYHYHVYQLSCCVQGLTLARPEIVPFRLTPSMVDGMGLCGFEGVYRRVMETCISVLRSNRETLLSVLEPFLQARASQLPEELGGCR